jgi:hypothetical protein
MGGKLTVSRRVGAGNSVVCEVANHGRATG